MWRMLLGLALFLSSTGLVVPQQASGWSVVIASLQVSVPEAGLRPDENAPQAERFVDIPPGWITASYTVLPNGRLGPPVAFHADQAEDAAKVRRLSQSITTRWVNGRHLKGVWPSDQDARRPVMSLAFHTLEPTENGAKVHILCRKAIVNQPMRSLTPPRLSGRRSAPSAVKENSLAQASKPAATPSSEKTPDENTSELSEIRRIQADWEDETPTRSGETLTIIGSAPPPKKNG